MKEFAFILGNGITRLETDVKSLMKNGKVYGCNRIYEEFSPHVLVSTDPGMATEIQESGYSKENVHYTRNAHIPIGSESHALPEAIQHMSSGPCALSLALDEGFSYCFLIGFDLKGHNNLHNNIYAGTKNYYGRHAKPTYHMNWVSQILTLLKKYTNQRIVQVNPMNQFTPESWKNHSNFSIMDLYAFNNMINN
jgi:hypothetical protein